jgi:hypothetical protein
VARIADMKVFSGVGFGIIATYMHDKEIYLNPTPHK